MDRISQEFYCGECKGYFLVRLNAKLNHEALIVCPNCKHEHRRCIEDGRIYEKGRFSSDVKEKILTSIANYHQKPLTDQMAVSRKRDGVVVTRDELSQSQYDERWASVAARERGEDT